jgi:hypothetical protein
LHSYERSLVKRYRGQPFALLGINCDEDRNEIREFARANRLTWRSWWDGGKPQVGPIFTRWNVRVLPSLFVLDQRGVIRYKALVGHGWLRTRQLDRVLDELLRTATR